MSPSRIAAYAFIVATFVVHAVVAWLSPVQGDDWNQLMWTRAHADDAGGAFLWAFVRDHATFTDVVSYAIASSTVLHALATPLAWIALVFGVFILGARRRPSLDNPTDVIALIALSALVWLGAPRAGVTLFHRPYAAQWIFGLAATTWLLVPFRCGWRAPRGATLVAAVGGLCAGSSARQLAIVALVLVVIAMIRGPRARWMWGALAGLGLGAVLVFLDRPQIDFRGFKPGFDATLKVLGTPIIEGGEVVSLLLALGLVKLVLSRLRPAWVPDRSPPDTRETLHTLILWLVISTLAMFGPRYTEALQFPGAVLIAAGAYPYVVWLANARPTRWAVIALAIGTHAIAWTMSLSVYAGVNADYRERIARLESGTGVVEIPPYTRVKPSFWFFGEDFGTVRQRQLVALQWFELDDIAIAPPFRGYERPVSVEARLVVEGVPDAQLEKTRVRRWGTTPAVARKQFEELVRNLEAALGPSFSAKLVVDDLPFAEARGRAVLLAAYDQGRWTLPVATRRGPNASNRVTISVRPSALETEYAEAYTLAGATATRIELEDGTYRLHPMTTDDHSIVACGPRQCLLFDSFVPRI